MDGDLHVHVDRALSQSSSGLLPLWTVVLGNNTKQSIYYWLQLELGHPMHPWEIDVFLSLSHRRKDGKYSANYL